MGHTPNGTGAVSPDAHGGDAAEPASVENAVNRIFSNRERRLERRLLDQVSKVVSESLAQQIEPLREGLDSARFTGTGEASSTEAVQRLEETQRQYEHLRNQYDEVKRSAENDRRARSEAQLTNAVDRELLRRGLRHPDVLRSYFREQCYVDDETKRVVIRGDESDQELGEYLDTWLSHNENTSFLPPLGRGGTGTTSALSGPPDESGYDAQGKSPGQVRQDLLGGHVQLVDPFSETASRP